MRVVSRLLLWSALLGIMFTVIGVHWLFRAEEESTRGVAFLVSVAVFLLAVICLALSVFFDKVGDALAQLDKFVPVRWTMDTHGYGTVEVQFDPGEAKRIIDRQTAKTRRPKP